MHYGSNAFAVDKSKPTITAKNGQKIEPSQDFTEVIFHIILINNHRILNKFDFCSFIYRLIFWI